MRKNLRAVLCFILIALTVFASTAALAAGKAYIFKVNGDHVRMHEGRNIGSPWRWKFNKGAKMLYLGDNCGGRLNVVSADGKKGYIYKDYLSPYGVVNKSKVYMTRAAAPLYTYSSRSGSFKATGKKMAAGRYFYRAGTLGGYALIKNLNGKSYIVQNAYLKKVF